MPKIDILEKDLTLTNGVVSDTDVVYIPGFANSNTNYYILTEPGQTPLNITDGYLRGNTTTISANKSNINKKLNPGSYPNYACNISDSITWKCVLDGYSYTWVYNNVDDESAELYVAPNPENIPTLCTTVREFESLFGTEPYQFINDEEVDEVFGNKTITYKAGEYDKSYIYAKELLNLGIPIVYENVVDRNVGSNTQIWSADLDSNLFKVNWTDSDDITTVTKDNINKDLLNAYINKIIREKNLSMKTTSSVGTFYFGYCELSSEPKQYAWKAFAVEAGTSIIDDRIDLGIVDIENIIGMPITGSLVPYVHTASEVSGSYIEVPINMQDVGFIKNAPSVKYLYDNLVACYTDENKISDKGEYTIKYITSGGYPTFEAKENAIVTAMVECAKLRGDAVAIIDALNNPTRTLSDSDSVYNSVQTSLSSIEGSYGTMFGPFWNVHTCNKAPKDATTQILPPSFTYLTALANAISTNANWLAMAGVNRGISPTIKSINSVNRISNSIADDYQKVPGISINAITNIKPYGLTIWGNRTLKNNTTGLSALSFLNIRNIVSDIKKIAYTSAKSLIFEQNTEILWNKFKSMLTPTLDKMVHGYGLSGYQIIKANTHYNGDPLEKGEVAALIRIYPIYAVENFEITVVLSDDNVEVQ